MNHGLTTVPHSSNQKYTIFSRFHDFLIIIIYNHIISILKSTFNKIIKTTFHAQCNVGVFESKSAKL